MIASSLREGDDIVDLLLAKGADVSCKSQSTVLFSLYKYRVLMPRI